MLASVSLRVWEIVVAFVVLIYAALEFSVGGVGVGVGIIAGTVVWLTMRVRVLRSDGRAGSYACRKAWLMSIQVVALLLALIAAVGTTAAALLAHWNRSLEGNVAIVALTGVELLIASELEPLVEDAINWLKGGRAEEEVGAELEPMRDLGWLVTHNWKRHEDESWDVDHIVCGPGGAFVVETKSGGFKRRYVSQAAGNAWDVQRRLEKLGVKWVQGVVCVNDPKQLPDYKDPVWVVSKCGLREWLLSQHRKSVDIRAVANALGLERL